MLGTICTKILSQMYALTQRPLAILETGTMFQDTFEIGETDFRERSTYAIADWMDKSGSKGHRFKSIDKDPSHIVKAQVMLGDLSQYVYHVHGDGEHCLALEHRLSPLDFLLLDSDSGGMQSYREFKVAIDGMDRNHGVILIDDAFKDLAVNKASLVRPEAERLRLPLYDMQRQALAIAIGKDAERILIEAGGLWL